MNERVFDVGVTGRGTVFAGGRFTTINGQPRTRLAAIDAAGSLTQWAPSANSDVREVEVDDMVIMVGGDFTTIDGMLRRGFAVFDR